jgi:hypothetical protein
LISRVFARYVLSFSQGRFAMGVSMYDLSAPIFIQFLTALSDVIAKAETHIKAEGIDESFMLSMRLYPDMYPFVLQVQQCCTHAERVCNLLAGKPALNLPNTEKTFGDLRARIANTIDHLRRFKPEEIDGTESKIMDLNGRRLPGRILLLNRILPHFYFHCTTAYDILRHCGVPLVKHDFLGTPLELLDSPEGLQNWSFSR